jgi:DNA modification methylase
MKIENIKTESLVPYARNAKTHPPAQVARIAGSIKEFGFCNPVLVDKDNGIIAGHGRVLAAQKLGLAEVPCIRLGHLTDAQRRAYILADNRLSESDGAGWDMEMLKLELADLGELDVDLEGIGFGVDDLADMELDMGAGEGNAEVDAEPQIDKAEELREKWGVEPGQLWELGDHRLLCGDCRKSEDVNALIGATKCNIAFTSPPYASQRKYDETSGFKPIPTDEYGKWFEAVQANIAAHLAKDGSFFLNIKEHCENGQRVLYVKDLTLAHVRQWRWMFVDEFCWRDTKNGVPGGWPNRFKDAWEPVFHFCKQSEIKFNATANGTESNAVFEYSPETAKTKTGSGLLGVKATAETKGTARPSNVIEVAAASTGDHSAAFPIGLPSFFIKAYTDAGDIVYEPFSGSGTTIIACEQLGRKARAIEISPAYVAVALQRWADATGKEPKLLK